MLIREVDTRAVLETVCEALQEADEDERGAFSPRYKPTPILEPRVAVPALYPAETMPSMFVHKVSVPDWSKDVTEAGDCPDSEEGQ